MADLQDIGRKLQGFGAGFRGRGPEFLAGLREQKKQLSDERIKAGVLDNRVLKDLLENGNIPQALQLLNNRVQTLQRVDPNADPSDTLETISLLESGNIKLALSEAEVVDREAVLRGLLPGKKVVKGQVIGEGDILVDPSTGKTIAKGPAIPVPEIPVQLLVGLSPEVADKSAAAFKAAGGGKDGIKAFTSIVDNATEQERRATSPQLLKVNFPNASPAETTQLQGAMDGAKTTSEGLKAAAKVREEQRRTKKAQSFQTRAVSLLEGVLNNPELNDVLGSVEGRFDFRFQDSESELIADITEAGDILTADNMDLMTGVLSESDIKLLKNLAGGGLSRLRSVERFRADAQKIIDTLGKLPVVTVDDRDGGEAGDSEGPVTQAGPFTIREIRPGRRGRR